MRCVSCGKKLKKNEKFCTVCGYYNDEKKTSLENDDFLGDLEDYEELGDLDDEEGEEQSSLINNINDYDEDSDINDYSLEEGGEKLRSFKDDRYIEAYIGEDYKWVMKRPFNIYALLLSWMYFIYRKLYLIGIIGLAISGIILRFVPSLIAPYIVISMIGSGFLFNKIYLIQIEKRVNKIIDENTMTDNFTIEEICKKKGGVNVILALIIFFAFLCITFLSFITFKENNENTKFWEENNTNKANCIHITKNAKTIVEDNEIPGEIEEAICEVQSKKYDIYLKVKYEGNTEYLYFKDEGEVLTLLGNTENIEDIESRLDTEDLKIGEEEFLEVSKTLNEKYKTMESDSKYEDELIKNKKNTNKKIHFIITEEEINR